MTKYRIEVKRAVLVHVDVDVEAGTMWKAYDKAEAMIEDGLNVDWLQACKDRLDCDPEGSGDGLTLGNCTVLA
jgi:hypothetical protein